MTTSDLSKNTRTLLHQPMPPGTAFVSRRAARARTTLARSRSRGGAAIVRGGELVMSCSDPTPLPTSAVVAIPKGPPVVIGGPPA
jgi:hypothetical protein